MEDNGSFPPVSRRLALLRCAQTAATLTTGAWLSACGGDERRATACDPPSPDSVDRDGGAFAAPNGDRPEPTIVLPTTVAGVEFPDTRLARAAAQLAFDASPEVLYNHLMRTYVFAGLYFRGKGQSYDPELAFVGSVLHDLGLLDPFMSPAERFELDGADAAMKLMTEWAVPPPRAEIVWDAIALHMNVSIATRKAPEIAMVSIGAVMDASGLNLAALSPTDVDEVVTTFPRLDFKQNAVETMTKLCEKKPLGQLLHPFADVGRRHVPGFALPTIEDLMLAAPFDE